MRILIDECLPRRLRRHLAGHLSLTVQQAGWGGTRNGALLARAETEFDVFITLDSNLSYQQSLAQYSLGFVVIHAASNRWHDIEPLIPEILGAIPKSTHGTVIHVPEQLAPP